MKPMFMQTKETMCNIKLILGAHYRSLVLFLGTISFNSLLDGFSIATIYPLVYAVLDEQRKLFYVDTINGLLGCHLNTESFSIAFLLVIAALFFLKFVFVMLAYYQQYNISRMIEVRLQSHILQGYMKRKYDFFVRSKVGDLIQRQMVHTFSCRDGILSLCEVVKDMFSILFVLLVLCWVSPKLITALIVLLLAVMGMYMWLARVRIYKKSMEHATLQEYVYSLAEEAINGMREIKIYGAERYFEDNFRRSALKQAKIYVKNATLAISPQPTMKFIVVVAIIAVMIFMVRAKAGGIQIVPLLAVYAGGIHRLVLLSSAINSGIMQMGIAIPSINIVGELLTSDSTDIEVSGGSQKVEKFNRDIVFAHVYFSHAGLSKDHLDNISATFEKGRSYGIIGPSGCGKSTLVDLIIGLYRPRSGRILIDGTDLSQIDISSWRQRIGVVSQNVFLFGGSIIQNIAFGCDPRDVDKAKAQEAARLSGFEEVVDRLQNGYESYVGEKGYKLSGGERQRLSIARAVYRDPDIYIFDEATSALDSYSEMRIQKAINALSYRKKLIITITHRLSTVIHMDRLIVMEEGKIIESGTHAELMQQSGYYSNLYRTQHQSLPI